MANRNRQAQTRRLLELARLVRGARFEHATLLNASGTGPLLCVVTSVRYGRVTWRPLDDARRESFAEADAGRFVLRVL